MLVVALQTVLEMAFMVKEAETNHEAAILELKEVHQKVQILHLIWLGNLCGVWSVSKVFNLIISQVFIGCL